ncbi:Cytochrome c oxidase assembly protein PET191-domain containing protein [Rhodotorula toruloides]|nr:Cytochrome c oxidase assembly protein PET191-domain containing protein [Rhodotorula toruloides]
MSCKGIRQALADCILRSDCVLRSDPPRSPQECIKEHSDELPEECQLLRKSFFECKRGMLDMRYATSLDPNLRSLPLFAFSPPVTGLLPRFTMKRFRGNEPAQFKTAGKEGLGEAADAKN